MDSCEMGNYINQLRKEKGLTQKQLAETLNVTNKSVSKWERGFCYPDIELIPKLASALGVTASEILNAKGQDAERNTSDESAAEETIPYSFFSWKDRMKRDRFLTAFIFLACCLISVIVCLICDICASGTLTWSRYVISSEILGSFIIIPILLKEKKGIPVTLGFITLLTVPFIWYLSYLTRNPPVFRIGWKISAASILFLWVMFLISVILKKKIFTAYAIILLCCIPFTLMINILLMCDMEQPLFDIWDGLTYVIYIGAAMILFVVQKRFDKKRKAK